MDTSSNNILSHTMLGAINMRKLEGNDFALQVHRRMNSQHKCFSQQLYGEVCEQKRDYHDLGAEWTQVQDDLHSAMAHEWFRRKYPERVDKILADATRGLQELDPRFGEISIKVLLRQPGLVYIGLVQLYIKTHLEEKRLVTDQHRHFLVVRNMLAA